MPKEFSGIDHQVYIATVHSYDVITRQLKVYIPKLMPMLSEGKSKTTIRTNLNKAILKNSPGLKYTDNISEVNTITVYAKDVDEPLPEIGSKVEVEFLEQNPRLGYWSKFNSNWTYEVIESEKYKKLYTLYINNEPIEIYDNDIIHINLPYDYDIVRNDDGKSKVITILPDTRLEDRVTLLESKVGNDKSESYDSSIGVSITAPSTGLYSSLETLNSAMVKSITNLQNEINNLKLQIAELNNED